MVSLYVYVGCLLFMSGIPSLMVSSTGFRYSPFCNFMERDTSCFKRDVFAGVYGNHLKHHTKKDMDMLLQLLFCLLQT